MDKRTEFVEKLSAQMVEWDVQLDRLKVWDKVRTILRDAIGKSN